MPSYDWNTFGSTALNGSASNDQFGCSVAFNSSGTILAVGSSYNDNTGYNAGCVNVYQYSSGAWSQIGDVINAEAAGDSFGVNLSLNADGTILAVGASGNDGNGTNSGSVRVYQYSNGAWAKIGGDIYGEATYNYFGGNVSLSDDGTILAASSVYNNGTAGTQTGSVRVYKYSSGSWTQIGSDIDGEAAYDHASIISLSSDGTILAIGAPLNDGNGENAGSVRVYQYSNSAWTKLGADIDGGAAGDYFGTSVALSSNGTILAASALYSATTTTEKTCSVSVYQYNGSTWSQIGSVINGESYNSNFGTSISLSSDGTNLAVGAKVSGKVYVYQYSNGSWSQLGSTISGLTTYEYFGTSVALSSDGEILACGIPNANGTYDTSGKVKVYQYTANNTISTNETVDSISDGTVTLSDGVTVTSVTGGDIIVSGDATISDLTTSTSDVTINSGKTLSVNSGTFSGRLSGSGRLNKKGSGTLNIGGSSNSSYTGSVNISQGKIKLTNNSLGLGSGTVSLGSGSTGATLEINSSSTSYILNNITASSSGENLLYNSGSSTVTTYGTLTKNGTTLTLAGNISVGSSIIGTAANSDIMVGNTTYTGNATYTSGGSYTYNGATTVTSGSTFTLEDGVSLPNSDVTIESGAAFVLSYSSAAISAKSIVLNGAMDVYISTDLSEGSYSIFEYNSKSGSTTTATIHYTGSNASLVTLSGTFGASGYTIIVSAVTVTPATGNVCFPAKTPVLTNQGYIHIDEMNPAIHTIRNKKIFAITKTVSHEKHLVRIGKNALGMNYPNKTTRISQNHKVFYKGEMIEAKHLVELVENVTFIPYKGEVLYNVLLDEHEKMQVNNLIVETLHPEHKVSKLYRMLNKMNVSQHSDAISLFNKYDREQRSAFR